MNTTILHHISYDAFDGQGYSVNPNLLDHGREPVVHVKGIPSVQTDTRKTVVRSLSERTDNTIRSGKEILQELQAITLERNRVLKSIIRETSPDPRVFFLTYIQQNSGEAESIKEIISQEIQNLMDQFQENFDTITHSAIKDVIDFATSIGQENETKNSIGRVLDQAIGYYLKDYGKSGYNPDFDTRSKALTAIKHNSGIVTHGIHLPF